MRIDAAIGDLIVKDTNCAVRSLGLQPEVFKTRHKQSESNAGAAAEFHFGIEG